MLIMDGGIIWVTSIQENISISFGSSSKSMKIHSSLNHNTKLMATLFLLRKAHESSVGSQKGRQICVELIELISHSSQCPCVLHHNSLTPDLVELPVNVSVLQRSLKQRTRGPTRKYSNLLISQV